MEYSIKRANQLWTAPVRWAHGKQLAIAPRNSDVMKALSGPSSYPLVRRLLRARIIEEIVQSQTLKKVLWAFPHQWTTLSQFHSGYYSRLLSYRHSIGWADEPICPNCHAPLPHIQRTWPPADIWEHSSGSLSSWRALLLVLDVFVRKRRGGDTRTTDEMMWDERKGWMNDEVDPPGPREERTSARVKVKEGGSQSRPAKWASWENCGRPARNWVTWRGAILISSGVLQFFVVGSVVCRCSWTAETCLPLRKVLEQKWSSGRENGFRWRWTSGR